MIDVKNAKGETFANMFQYQGTIYNNAVDGLTEEAALKRASDNTNHTNWLLGHILHCRYMLANMIGVDEVNPFDKTYWGPLEEKDYPAVAEITKHMPAISEQLISKLSSMSDEELDAKPAEDKPSLTDMVSFFLYHEAYHIGQIGIVRKINGMDPLKSH